MGRNLRRCSQVPPASVDTNQVHYFHLSQNHFVVKIVVLHQSPPQPKIAIKDHYDLSFELRKYTKHKTKDNDRNLPAKVFCAAYAEEECRKHLALTLQVLLKESVKHQKLKRREESAQRHCQYLLSATKWLAQTRNPELARHLPQKYIEARSPQLPKQHSLIDMRKILKTTSYNG